VSAAPESSPERVVRGFVVLAAARIGTQAIGFVAIAIAARRLGPENLGAFQFAMSVALYFAIPVNVGLTLSGIRDVARNPAQAREVAGEVLTLQAILAVVAFGVLLALTPVLAADSRSEAILPIAGLTFVAGAVSLDWVLRGLQKFGTVALARLAGQAIYGALVPVLLVGGVEGGKRLAWLTVLAVVVTSAICTALAWRARSAPRLTLDVRRLRRRFLASAPIGIAFVMIQVYYSIDSVMLGYLRSTADVGQYAVAYKIPLALTALSGIWIQALYPHAAALFERDREELRRQVGRFASLALVVALPLGAGATIVGGDLMPALFGDDYRDAGTPFVLLMWASALIMVTVNFANVLLATGDDRPYAIGVTLGAILNVGLNFALIPELGTTGAAINTIAAETLVIAYMLVRFTRVIGPVSLDGALIARGALAALAMVALLLALSPALSPIALVAAGIVTWGALAFALGVVTREDLRRALGPAAAGGDAGPST
jgi:O-antigen/teichoic acid export membrane protein